MKFVYLAIFIIVIGIIFYTLYKNRNRVQIIGEFFSFLKERKLWWLTPIIIVFILLSVLIIVTEKSVLAPLIYALF